MGGCRARVLWNAALAGAIAFTAGAHAQDWKPGKPVEFVVPAGAGGTLDRPARLVQKIWQEGKLLPVPVNVVNKSGGGQSVGATYVQLAEGDPHRILLMSGPLLSNHITGRSKLHYTDFTVVGQLFNEYNVLSVRSDAPFRTASELIARLKPAPDSLAVAIGTTQGNNSHVAVAAPFKRAGIDIRRLRTVVFPSASESVLNLLGGHLDYVSSATSVVLPHWQSGKIRILAVTAPARLEGELAKIPTWKEQGIDVVVTNARYVLAPPRLTPAQVAYWDGMLRRAVASPEWREALAQQQWVDEFIGAANAREHIERHYAQAREILADLGLAKAQ